MISVSVHRSSHLNGPVTEQTGFDKKHIILESPTLPLFLKLILTVMFLLKTTPGRTIVVLTHVPCKSKLGYIDHVFFGKCEFTTSLLVIWSNVKLASYQSLTMNYWHRWEIKVPALERPISAQSEWNLINPPSAALSFLERLCRKFKEHWTLNCLVCYNHVCMYHVLLCIIFLM